MAASDPRGGGSHVVLGTGPLGLAVARRLAAAGRPVRAVNRTGRAELPPGVDVTAAVAADVTALRRAVAGASVLYTFIDDFAAALVTLGEREAAAGQVWHVPNDETVSTRAFVGRVFAESGAKPRVRALPGPMLALLAVFSPTLRAVREVVHQLEHPFVVDHSKFARAFGAHPTPQVDAIRQTAPGTASAATPDAGRPSVWDDDLLAPRPRRRERGARRGPHRGRVRRDRMRSRREGGRGRPRGTTAAAPSRASPTQVVAASERTP